MLIKIDTQKLIEKSKTRRFTIKNSILNQTNHGVGDQPIRKLSGGVNKLKWYMDKYFHKLEKDHLKLLFNKRGALVNEPILLVDTWKWVTMIRNLIAGSINVIFKEEIKGKKPSKWICKRIANEFIQFMQKDRENAFIEFDTNTSQWDMNYYYSVNQTW